MADDNNSSLGAGSVEFSAEALAEKYRIEREKRIRTDGLQQYVDPAKISSDHAIDPFVQEEIVRDPIEEDFDVLVIGGGFSGMMTAVDLQNQGVTNYRIVEKGADFGGAWYWNRYPGVACDVESYIYLPLLEETGYIPTQKYVGGAEIFAYCQQIGRQFHLYDSAIFQTGVTAVRWIEERQRYVVETDRGDRLMGRFVILAGGLLHKPKIPNLPGVDSFKGKAFHTSRWDYEYTGGDSTGNLSKLADKRIGIIGTGATAIQVIPQVGASAKELYVFQRTPSSVDVRANCPTDPDFAKSLKPGWHERRMVNFHTLASGGYDEEDLVSDGWTSIARLNRAAVESAGDDQEKMAELLQLADFQKMEEIRARIDSIVKDPKTAEALKPYYNRHCKRPCFHDQYLPTFNRPSVTLVDTEGQGVERITPNGVVSGGVEYELDCLIYATGFEFGTTYTSRLGFDVAGRNGFLLSEKDKAYGSLHGITSRDFPNLLMINASQSAATINFPHILSEVSRHIAYIAGEALRRNVIELEPTVEAEEAWVREIMGGENAFFAAVRQCTPSYYNNEGSLGDDEATMRRGLHPAGAQPFIDILRAWRAAGDLQGLQLKQNALTEQAN